MSDLDRQVSEGTNASGGSPAPTPAEPSSTKDDVAGTLLKVCALAVSLWMAIGAACEILNRNQDYDRVSSQQKALLTCMEAAKGKPGCSDEKGVKGGIETASVQIQRYHSLNANGAWDRCHTAAVFASTESFFFEDCIRLLRRLEKGKAIRPPEMRKNEGPTIASLALPLHQVLEGRDTDPIELAEGLLHNPENEFALSKVLSPPWGSYSGPGLAFDQAAKDHLYFLLVLVSTVIGTLIAALRNANNPADPQGLVASARQLAMGIGAGFAVYVLLRGGNFVFFSGASVLDVLNPFSAAAAGFLVGLYSERVFKFLEHTVPGTQQPSPHS